MIKSKPIKQTTLKVVTQKPTNAIRYKLEDYLQLSKSYETKNWTV